MILFYLVGIGALCLLLSVVAGLVLRRRNVHRARQAALFDSAMRARFSRKGN